MERITWIIIWYVTISFGGIFAEIKFQAYRGSMPCGIRELIDPCSINMDADRAIA
jgi:hypothetical protein